MLRVFKILTLITLSMGSMSMSAQDLLANRAPSDRKLTDLKTIKINNTPAFIDLHNPAANIYTSWDDKAPSIAPGTLPANFKIDLRGFAMPTTSRKVTSNFGRRWGTQHQGIDIKVYQGDTIYSAFDGKVRIVKSNPSGWGKYVVIRHPNGLETLYAHLSKQLVIQDQIVRAGQPIGLGGATGRATGTHLHLETRLLGKPINPAKLFDFERQDVTGDFYVVNTGTIQNTKKTAVASTLTSNKELQMSPLQSQSSTSVGTQIIQAPAEAPTTSAPNQEEKNISKETTYVVKDGDNLFRIATTHGLTLDQLCKLNGLKPTSTIKRGQVLKCS